MKNSLRMAGIFLLAVFTVLTMSACSPKEQVVNYGEATALEFVEFTLQQTEVVRKIKRDIYQDEADEGKKIFVLSGSIKNVSSAEYAPRIVGKAVFDGEMEYILDSMVIEGNSFGKLTPLSEGELLLTADIPDEVAENFVTCEVTFGFNEKFEDGPISLDKAKYVYQITVSKDSSQSSNTITDASAKIQEIAVGGNFATDFAEMTVAENGVAENLQVTLEDDGSTFTTGQDEIAGKKFVYIKGNIKNIYNEEYDADNIVGNAVIDGNNYKLKVQINNNSWTTSSQIAPLETKEYVLYAEVPVELADSFQSCEFNFGFDDAFQTDYGALPEDCAYQYSVKVK